MERMNHPQEQGSGMVPHRLAYPVALVAALALPALAGAAAELALRSADGLELVNVIAEPDTLKGRDGLKISGDPEVLRAAGAKRRELIAAMRARGEQPRGPGTFESTRFSS